MKKIFLTMMLAVALIIVSGQSKQAQAYDQYVGTSNATGWKCYVKTETIYWEHPYEFDVTLKMVTKKGNVKNLHYHFMIMQHWAEFTNSQGYSGRVSEDYPIEYVMYDFVLDYSAQHKIRYK